MIKENDLFETTPFIKKPLGDIVEVVKKLTKNYTEIIPIDEIKKHPELYWGGNGVGDRWAKKRFNYGVIQSNRVMKLYTENDDDKIPEDVLKVFFVEFPFKGSGIKGIYVFSERVNISKRPISKHIHIEITKHSCVVCGTKSDIVCDHKNDLYNDDRVLNVITQQYNDFQPLCNHCNLQKRQICKEEEMSQKIYSAKNIRRYTQYEFEFPWEKKVLDKRDIHCKKDTFWYDPVEFEHKIYCYAAFVLPIVKSLNKAKFIKN